jgi:hypothetical protein
MCRPADDALQRRMKAAVDEYETPAAPLGSFPAVFSRVMSLGLLSRRRVHDSASQQLQQQPWSLGLLPGMLMLCMYLHRLWPMRQFCVLTDWGRHGMRVDASALGGSRASRWMCSRRGHFACPLCTACSRDGRFPLAPGARRPTAPPARRERAEALEVAGGLAQLQSPCHCLSQSLQA